MTTAWAVLLVLIGCCTNVITLELLIKEDPGCGNLITFTSFLFITIEGFIFTTKCGTLAPKVPFRAWTTLVIMYFLVSVTNNYALNFNISMPLHMIFRAGSLMANMILGMIILHKRYSFTKYASVIMISIGIATCTIMSGKEVKNVRHDNVTTEAEREMLEADDVINFWWWIVGICMLSFALFLSARMGIYQEVIYAKYGKYPREALFYSHCLPLPGFLLLSQDIYTHLMIAINSPPIVVLGIAVPSMVLYLVANIATQWICISAVFRLTSECASLTVTLVVTLRKFISLLFSIWYFQNPFTVAHWFGTVLVFSGTLMFSDVPGMIKRSLKSDKDKKE